MKLRNDVWLTTAILSLSLTLGMATEPRPFLADITHGNIRCVLMSVGQTTVFPNEQDKSQLPKAPGGRDGELGVRCFTVTFLVEKLGDAPFESHALKNLQVFSSGKPLPLVGGTYLQAFGYENLQIFLDFSKPKVSSPKRAVIRRYVWFGAVPDLEALSLIIETGFDKDIETFQFDSIRLK
jgi:hypothetical protein